MSENFGDLSALEKLGKEMKNSYTVEQLLNPHLKNIGGESNEEVRKRMLEFCDEILSQSDNKRIAVVSHGAAIKFLLQNWCKYKYEEDAFYFNDKFVLSQKFEAPCLIKIIIDSNRLLLIEEIRNEVISK